MSAEFVRSLESLAAADRALLVDAIEDFEEGLESLLDGLDDD